MLYITAQHIYIVFYIDIPYHTAHHIHIVYYIDIIHITAQHVYIVYYIVYHYTPYLYSIIHRHTILHARHIYIVYHIAHLMQLDGDGKNQPVLAHSQPSGCYIYKKYMYTMYTHNTYMDSIMSKICIRMQYKISQCLLNLSRQAV
jgi:hypothetical protein